MPAQRHIIVDDSPAVRRSLSWYIAQNRTWEVCGEAENGQIAVEKVGQLNPDLVILDLHMPVMNGLEAAKRISQTSLHTTMVLYTMQMSDQISRVAQAAGIKSVFLKSDSPSTGLLGWLKTIAATE